MRLLAVAVGAVMVLAGSLNADAETRPQPVTGWIRHNAVPLDTVDPAAPLDDLAPVRRSVGAAKIVGLGESTHGAAEEITLKHRTLRLLVEQMGFRSVAWEDDWTLGLQINKYIRTGEGDLDVLMRQMSPQWQSRQMADVLRWLRDYNAGQADKVQFVGVEYYLTPVCLGPGETVALPQPAPGWFERPFGKIGVEQFALDLRTPAPPPVRRWLEAPIRTRGLPDRGPDSYMAGGTLAQWFDVIVHRQEVTPVQTCVAS